MLLRFEAQIISSIGVVDKDTASAVAGTHSQVAGGNRSRVAAGIHNQVVAGRDRSDCIDCHRLDSCCPHIRGSWGSWY